MQCKGQFDYPCKKKMQIEGFDISVPKEKTAHLLKSSAVECSFL
jgi:hypothetical protein